MGSFNAFAAKSFLDSTAAAALVSQKNKGGGGGRRIQQNDGNSIDERPLEFPSVVDVNEQLLNGACYLQRVRSVLSSPLIRDASRGASGGGARGAGEERDRKVQQDARELISILETGYRPSRSSRFITDYSYDSWKWRHTKKKKKNVIFKRKKERKKKEEEWEDIVQDVGFEEWTMKFLK